MTKNLAKNDSNLCGDQAQDVWYNFSSTNGKLLQETQFRDAAN